MLYDVDLTDITFICVTYTMRRIGFCGSIDEFFKLDQIKFSLNTKLHEGDILVWNHCSEHGKTYPLIIEKNVIYHKYIKFSNHFAVYEGNGIISDTFTSGEMEIPNIRYRKLADIQHFPDSIILNTWKNSKGGKYA